MSDDQQAKPLSDPDPHIRRIPQGWLASCCGMLASTPAHAARCENYRPRQTGAQE